MRPGERGDEDGDGIEFSWGEEGVVAESGEGGVLVRDSGVRKDGEICSPLQLPPSLVGMKRPRSLSP